MIILPGSRDRLPVPHQPRIAGGCPTQPRRGIFYSFRPPSARKIAARVAQLVVTSMTKNRGQHVRDPFREVRENVCFESKADIGAVNCDVPLCLRKRTFVNQLAQIERPPFGGLSKFDCRLFIQPAACIPLACVSASGKISARLPRFTSLAEPST